MVALVVAPGRGEHALALALESRLALVALLAEPLLTHRSLLARLALHVLLAALVDEREGWQGKQGKASWRRED